MTIILAILLLCILITVHEFGHFIAARLTGIPVGEFAIGMGPKILSWKSRKYDTRFSLRLLPVGGYCAFIGEDDLTGEHTENPDAFNRQQVWRRLLTIMMGPLLNFVLALVVAFCYFAITPSYNLKPVPGTTQITAMDVQSPAEAAGLMVGDRIISIEGESMEQNDTNAMIEALNRYAAKSDSVELTVMRGDQRVSLNATPSYIEGETYPYRLGITLIQDYDKINLHARPIGQAIKDSWQYCLMAGGIVFETLGAIFTSPEARSQAAGPVGIISLISQQTAQGGADAYVQLLIMISVNLGIMNLLPIPGLDGSRILFHLLEAVRGKPVDQRREAMVHGAGLVLLLGLFVVLTFQDVMRLFSGG